jgi:hypothetical protein
MAADAIHDEAPITDLFRSGCMIPHELPAETIHLPATDRHTIVLVTGSSGSNLPYERFALRMQQEFGSNVVAWFQCRPKSVQSVGSSRLGRIKASLRTELRDTYRRPMRAFSWPGKFRRLFERHILKRDPLVRAQERLFADEVAYLRRSGKLEPIAVQDPDSPEFCDRVRRLDPYFLLSLGGPLYSPALLQIPRGIALNQHAGWSPDYRGSHTVHWALYHRDLDRVGSTIHSMVSGADAGPILRRAQACVLPGDDPATCFARVVALGTELMCEVVHDLIADKRTVVFPQPAERGRTYRAKDLDAGLREWIDGDRSKQWLAAELRRLRRF